MKLGVLLLNLGGPAELKDVRPFLYNLFSDPDIIPVPFAKLLQKPLAKMISIMRGPLSSKYYAAIGGGSPLNKITGEQAAALVDKLKHHFNDAGVYVAMRYWHPTTEEAWHQIQKDGITELVVLPLYPQYSFATTESSYRVLKKLIQNDSPSMTIHWIDHWYDHPKYLNAFAEKIQEGINALPAVFKNDFDLIFSAHSLPMKLIEAGDPYDKQIRSTIELLLQRLPGVSSWHLSYQSKTGPIKWLKPSTSDLLVTLSKKRKRALLVVPISFVSDHVETLYEIDILYKSEANTLGFPHFSRVPSLNCSPEFISSLEDLVLSRVKPK